jgi:cytochrome P450 family 4
MSNIFLETAMGTKFDSKERKVAEYKKAIYRMGEIVIERFTKIWLHISIIYFLSPLRKLEKSLVNTMHTFTTAIIRERRSTRNKDDNMDVDHIEDDISSKKRMAMLDLLLKAESNGEIDENGIREEVDTFTFEVRSFFCNVECLLILIKNRDTILQRCV